MGAPAVMKDTAMLVEKEKSMAMDEGCCFTYFYNLDPLLIPLFVNKVDYP